MGALLLKVIEKFSILLGVIFFGIFSGKLLYLIKGGDAELFANYNEDYEKQEIDWGEPVGKEVW